MKLSTKRLADPRPETRRVQKGPNNIKLVRHVKNSSIRKWYIERCVEPCIEKMKRNHRTLGIAKPIMDSVDIVEIEKKDEKELQLPLTLWGSTPYINQQVAQERWKKEYAKKGFEVRFRFWCEKNVSISTT